MGNDLYPFTTCNGGKSGTYRVFFVLSFKDGIAGIWQKLAQLRFFHSSKRKLRFLLVSFRSLASTGYRGHQTHHQLSNEIWVKWRHSKTCSILQHFLAKHRFPNTNIAKGFLHWLCGWNILEKNTIYYGRITKNSPNKQRNTHSWWCFQQHEATWKQPHHDTIRRGCSWCPLT